MRKIEKAHMSGDEENSALYHAGINQAVDVAILHKDNILIIKRADTDNWALPGGMVEAKEDLKTAAARELAEETGIKIKDKMLQTLFHSRVNDPRNTGDAWIETDVFYIKCMYVPQVKLNLKEVKDFKWITKKDIENIKFHANHGNFIERIFGEVVNA